MVLYTACSMLAGAIMLHSYVGAGPAPVAVPAPPPPSKAVLRLPPQ
jgi:hypothetical protein